MLRSKAFKQVPMPLDPIQFLYPVKGFFDAEPKYDQVRLPHLLTNFMFGIGIVLCAPLGFNRLYEIPRAL